ncbi:UIM domain containing protein [Trichuris trichiura]|uniref:26S proteasome non-ATPase regulatory subunit 4 n=1 Tax=Trichuris trichiura TaxID=36087 RepID=A0A077ZMI0_TRITR|nr:UIM domain containing protein [Trichuris trichiura]
MGLESTMICVDSSEFMRNGDYFPSRLEAERDAVNLIVQCKLRANAENTVVGQLTHFDNGRIFMKLHQLTPKGECQPMTAIRVAHLALKHRQNRNHRTRIVVFIGSPIRNDIQEVISTKLKKEKVNVDVISFGVGDVNSEKLKAFVDTLNGKDGTGSHLVVVPPGSSLQESLLTSAIIRGDGDEPSTIPSINAAGFAFGVDPNEDPELAMALRVSLEEQRQRQELDAMRNAVSYRFCFKAEITPLTEEDEQLLIALQLSLDEARRNIEESAKKVKSGNFSCCALYF